MSEELNQGVNPVAEAPATPPVAEAPQAPVVGEDVKPQEKDTTVLYENAKKARDEERERRKAAEQAAADARAELARLQASQQTVQPEQDDEAVQRFYANEAKTNLLIMANSDPFVRDNIAELSQEIAANPMQGAEVAVQRLKASYMDTILKSSDIERPRQTVNQVNQTATPEPQNAPTSLDPNLPDLEARLAEKLGE